MALAGKLRQTGACWRYKYKLGVQLTPDGLKIIKVLWALKCLVLLILWQNNRYLFTAQLLLCENGSQYTLAIIIGSNIDDANLGVARIFQTQQIRAISLSHGYPLLQVSVSRFWCYCTLYSFIVKERK